MNTEKPQKARGEWTRDMHGESVPRRSFEENLDGLIEHMKENGQWDRWSKQMESFPFPPPGATTEEQEIFARSLAAVILVDRGKGNRSLKEAINDELLS